MAEPPLIARHSTPVAAFVPIPRSLVQKLYDTPLALGIYALIARRFAIEGTPVPLSAGDIQAYDPSLSYGAVVRALARLTTSAWLIATTQRGNKTQYVPTWGAIRSAPRQWQMQAPKLGRPPHVAISRLPAQLLDLYMGKLTPHGTRPALITRYITTPALSLTDVGAYILSLCDLPRPTPALLRVGLMRGQHVCSVPDDIVIITQLSQLTLDNLEGPALTTQGLRRLGYSSAEDNDDQSSQLLFFVPTEVIGNRVGTPISSSCGNLIGFEEQTYSEDSALGSASSGTQVPEENIPCSDPSKTNESNHIHPEYSGGGCNLENNNSKEPATESIELLRSIGVRPDVIPELSGCSPEQIRAAIADAQRRDNVRSNAAWVVSLLRLARDHQWHPPAEIRSNRLPWPQREEVGDKTSEVLDPVSSAEQADSDPTEAHISADSGLDNDTVNDTQALEQSLRLALRQRLTRHQWSLIDKLGFVLVEEALHIHCANSTMRREVEQWILPHMRVILSDQGLSFVGSCQVRLEAHQ